MHLGGCTLDMTRWIGFFLFVMMFFLMIVGGWLAWSAVELIRFPPPIQDLTQGPATKWYYIRLIVGVLVMVVGLRTGLAGFALVRGEDHMIFFLPAEAWSLVLGIGVFVYLVVTIQSRVETFLTDERPKRCVLKLPPERQKTGKEWHCHSNGRWARVGYWKDGNKHGVWESWYPNGKHKSVGHFKMGVRHGIFRLYNNSGRLLRSYRYENGKLDGRFVEHYDRGAFTPLKRTGHYAEGRRCGQWTYWDAFVRQGLVQRKHLKTENLTPCE